MKRSRSSARAASTATLTRETRRPGGQHRCLRRQLLHVGHRARRRPHHGSVCRGLAVHVDEHHRGGARGHQRRCVSRRHAGGPPPVPRDARLAAPLRRTGRSRHRAPGGHRRRRRLPDPPGLPDDPHPAHHPDGLLRPLPDPRHDLPRRRQADRRGPGANGQCRGQDLRLLHARQHPGNLCHRLFPHRGHGDPNDPVRRRRRPRPVCADLRPPARPARGRAARARGGLPGAHGRRPRPLVDGARGHRAPLRAQARQPRGPDRRPARRGHLLQGEQLLHAHGVRRPVARG